MTIIEELEHRRNGARAALVAELRAAAHAPVATALPRAIRAHPKAGLAGAAAIGFLAARRTRRLRRRGAAAGRSALRRAWGTFRDVGAVAIRALGARALAELSAPPPPPRP